jgi:hypothetical protein
LAAQFAAEATLRRVHAAQKDDDMPPIEAILAPLEAELKLSRQEVMLGLYSQLFFICVYADVFLRFLLHLQIFHTSSHPGSSNYPFLICHLFPADKVYDKLNLVFRLQSSRMTTELWIV